MARYFQPTELTPLKSLAMLAALLLVTAAVAAIGGIVTAGSVDGWYAGLAKARFTPPNWVFGPAWTILYLLMALAGWRAWRAAGRMQRPGLLRLYGMQLGINLLWSILFFGLHWPMAALLNCVLLLLLVVLLLYQASRHDRFAAILLTPYAAWVGFACVLNSAIVWLN
ncbi:MAG: TspO/MBR family protein [Dongiaceae bacterium]